MRNPILLGIEPTLSDANLACIELLEEALAQAKKGIIHTVGIAVCFKTGYAAGTAGPKAAELNLAVDTLKAKILAAVDQQQPAKQ